MGTYIAFDTPNASVLLKEMKSLGVLVGSCGVKTIRLRPMLIFTESHIDPLIDAFNTVLTRI